MEQHFLIVSFSIQGHINPALRLRKRLCRTDVTFSTVVDDGLISYIPYSDGFNRGDYVSRIRDVGWKTLSAIVRSLAERGRPVTCVILSLPWMADIACHYGIPSVLYWIQPATIFAIYHHYFHSYGGVIASRVCDPCFEVAVSGIPPVTIRELPSLLTITVPDDPYTSIFESFQEIFSFLDRQKSGAKPRVLINTFDELEADALAVVSEVKLIAVGPVVACSGADLFEPDEKRYMEWLDSRPEGSVVSLSFGSLALIKKRQMEEILRGLKESGRPYLLAVRKDNRSGAVEELGEENGGMVVDWCSQVRVRQHPVVGVLRDAQRSGTRRWTAWRAECR
uniref:Glycosyltransferase n=1 Tax=Musa acuminata subsp. malaccensis TaxID=214687 RepID=A0A804L0V4_MUSAM